MANLTTIILTYNEELNIEECIKSILQISERIIVVDSFSNDKTVEIAKKLGVEVYQNEFINQAKQFKYGLNIAKIRTQWVLRIDADERLTNNSAKEIGELCNKNLNTDINGIVVRFEVNFLGRKLKHGGIYPFKKLIVFKYGLGEIEDRNMDEHIFLLKGRAVEVINDSLHCDYKDLSAWIEKHNKYSSREVIDYFESFSSRETGKGLDKGARLKRFIKFNVYYKLPMGIRSYLYYMYRYYYKMGFLDGKEGEIFAFLQAYWYRYLVDAKIYEKNKKNSETKLHNS